MLLVSRFCLLYVVYVHFDNFVTFLLLLILGLVDCCLMFWCLLGFAACCGWIVVVLILMVLVCAVCFGVSWCFDGCA